MGSDVQNISEKINSGNHASSGKLKIGSYETLVTYLWPDFLVKFSKQYPELKIDLITRSEKEHWSKLLSGSLDAIVDAEPVVGHQWDSHILYTDQFNFFASKKYIEGIDRKNLVYVEKAHDENGLSIRDHCMKNEIQFLESYKLDTFVSVKAFTLAGLGIGVLPERFAKSDLEAGYLKRISIKGFSSRGFGRHRICFSVTQVGRSDLRIKLLQQELKKFLALQNQ
jgi:DNA-binding transcriptional LysR family regulator